MRIDLLSLAILIIGSLLVGQASAESKDVGSASPVAQVTPLNVTLGESVVINYTVLDTHGTGLKQVELWRKEEDGTWQKIKQETLAGNTGPVSGSFTDSPFDPGIYWYGVHVVDNTGKWNDEQNANTAYQPGNWGPAEVAVVDPASPIVQAFKVTPLNVSFDATGMAENTSTKSNATMQLTVFTDSNSSATYVDIPPIGKSQGDTYYVNNNLHSENASGPIVGELFASTTVVKMSPSNISGPEQRYVSLDYTFNNKTDQIIVGSISDYPVEGHAFEMNRTIIRPILGGSGKYFGVTGQVATTHNADGSYTHVFTMLR